MQRHAQHLEHPDVADCQSSLRRSHGQLQCLDLPIKVVHRSRSAASAFLFGSSEDDPFSQKIEPWNSKCPRWMPGYGSRSHGFCRKLKPPKKKWFPPEEPEPNPSQPSPPRQPPNPRQPNRPNPPTQPPNPARPSRQLSPRNTSTQHHRHRRPPPSNSPWEQPASEARQEQAKANTEEPQVPFTAPAVPPPRRLPQRPARDPPTPPEELGGDLAPAPVPVSPRGRRPKKVFAEEEPFEPKPGLIVEQKTKPAPPPEDPIKVGTFEDDEPDEAKLIPPEAKSILKNQLSKEAIEAAEEQEERDSLPTEVPGTTPPGPFWPPPSTAPPVQPIPPRPGDPNYNYGWVPPEERVPYSPPWPGGGPAVAVDRAEAVVEEVNDEANAVLKTAEDALVNTTV